MNHLPNNNLRSLRYLLLTLILSIFIGETLIMLFIDQLPSLAEWQKALFDATLLLVLTFPAIFFLVFLPLKNQIHDLLQSESLCKAAAEEMLQNLLRYVPGIVFQFQLRPDGRYCLPYANQALLEIYRVKLEDVREDASSLFLAVHPDDIERHLLSIQTSAQQQTPWVQEYRLKFGEEAERWLFGNALPQRLEDGSTLWHGYVADITERKQAEQALQTENVKNLALLRNASDGICIMDIDGNIVEVSESFCAMLGYQRHEMLGMHVSAWDAKFVGDELEQIVSLVFAGKVRTQFETRHRHKDGRILDVEVSAYPVDLDGSPVLFTSTRDISERFRLDNILRLKERYQRALLDNFPYAVWLKDTQSRFLTVNTEFARIIGANHPDDLVGKNDFDISPEDLAAGYRADDLEVLSTCRNKILEERILTEEGLKWFETYKAPVMDANGEMLGTVGFARDITAHKQAEENLHLAASVFSHAREGIMITKPDGAIIDVNAAFTQITGYGREEVLGHNPRILSSGLQGREYYSSLWSGLHAQGFWHGEIWNRRKDGKLFYEMLTISSVKTTQGEVSHYVALFSDITALKEQQRQLENIAHYDALTNLPNRVLLADRLQQAMSQSLRRQNLLAVVYLDLDGFKQINDKHGHETGDQLLIAVTAHMKQVLREVDTLARFGGDEFVAVLLDLESIEACVPMLNRLLAAAAIPVRIDEQALKVSASLGVAFYPQTEDVDADQLFRQADQAMYQAKLLGKNRYHIFDPKQDSDIRGHHESINHIRQAFNNHEFVLYYQPKVNMRDGNLIGVEALIRWQHPERGLLLPVVFLPIVEDHQLAVDIGEWVIDTAMRQLELWRHAGLDMQVSVNVGARQLQQADFIERLREIMAAHPEIPPARLELEVLETSALEDIAHVFSVIEGCRTIGVRFALDDFGTGYSSLTYLKRLPVTLLKIDQSFVRNMLDDLDDLAILKGVIGLAEAPRDI